MFSVRRIKEFCSTIRIRLVLWVALVVLLMEIISNFAVSQIEERALHKDYDQYLEETIDRIHAIVISYEPAIRIEFRLGNDGRRVRRERDGCENR